MASSDFDANKANKAMDQYSRQIGTIGVEAQQRLASLDVLVIGAQGVGVEVAKNIALLGARSVTLSDDTPVAISDLGSNYWFKESDIGKARAQVCLEELSKLNPFTNVSRHEGAVSDGDLTRFGVVIVTSLLPRATLERWGEICHNHTISVTKDDMEVVVPSPILFIVAVTLGVASFLFSDMGNSDTASDGTRVHTVTDSNGEPPVVNVVEAITYGTDEKGCRVLVRVPGNKSHNLDDGDRIYFSEVTIPSLCNDSNNEKDRLVFTVERVFTEYEEEGRKSQKLVPDHFVIRPTSCEAFENYTAGGFATQVKPVTHLSFRPFASSVVSPITPSCVFGSMLPHPNSELMFTCQRGEQLHFALLALWAFQEQHNRLPALHSTADAEECVKLAQSILEKQKSVDGALVVEEIDRQVVINTALYAAVELASNCAFLGGIAAQEIVKKSGKYTPMHQWLYLDTFELLQENVPADATPIGSRYDNQIAIFGRAFQEKIGKQRWFMVGCGALGCEYLKGFALMGLGADGGQIQVTDNDRIEVSNLNRQFLFRAENVGFPKSVCAANAAKRMNPAMNIKSYEIKVCPETENTFNTEFWTNLDGVCNALDNVHARRYTDSRCVLFKKPLLESGTLGTKANSEIIIPFHTQSYNDVKELENDDAIPMCTLKLFPHLIEHCIEWGRAEFHDVFEALPKDIEKFITDRNGYFATLKKSGTTSTHLEQLNKIKSFLQVLSQKSLSFTDCMQLAVDLFLNRFRDRILDLTHSCPENYVKKNDKGEEELFWTGVRRFPRAADLPSTTAASGQAEDDWALNYLIAATNLYAFMFNLPQVSNIDEFRAQYSSAGLRVREWQPPAKLVNVNDDSGEEQSSDEDISTLKALEAELRAFDASGITTMPVAADFEKDDDTNFHIDFITACSNMRAGNYHIKQATRFKVKMIAGRITPALATTTAMITGVTLNEMYKFLLGVPPAKQFQSNINLALATFNFFEVVPPKKTSSGWDDMEGDDVVAVPEGWNTWDTLAINAQGLTCQQFVDAIAATHHGVQARSFFVRTGPKTEVYLYKRNPLPTDDKEWFAAARDRLLIDVITERAGPQVGEYVHLEGSFDTADGDAALIPPLYARIA